MQPSHAEKPPAKGWFPARQIYSPGKPAAHLELWDAAARQHRSGCHACPRHGGGLETFPVKSVDAAGAGRDTLELGIVRASGAAAILMLKEMDHLMRHGRH